jgi:CubicO group peptidase (beta-lactamase class C family)
MSTRPWLNTGPRFAANGKDRIEVRQVLGHTSGVSGWEAPFAVADMYDWEASTQRVAAQRPWWEQGTAAGNHAANQGHLVGELVRRVTGMPLERFVAQEIAGPLGAEAANTAAWRQADTGAVNGHGNASLGGSHHQDADPRWARRGDTTAVLDTIQPISDEQSHGLDLVLGVQLRFGMGYAPPETETVPYAPQGSVLLLGRLGVLHDHRRSRPAPHDRLHDEQDGARHHRI